jgi:ribonuclease Z
MLFDCGEGTQLQMEKVRVSPMKIKRIFISHWHADHFAGLLPLIETLHLSRRKEPLEIYGPEASRFVDALIELSYWGVGFKIIAKDCGEEEFEKICEGDNYEIFAIKVKHSVPAVGFMFKEKDHWKIDVSKANKFGLKGKTLREIKEKGSIKINSKTVKLNQIANLRTGRKVLYSGDTIAFEGFFNHAKEADLLIHDSTFFEEIEERPHSNATDIAKLAKKYKVKQLALTHISKRYRHLDPKDLQKIFKNIVIAKDLMKLTLK